MPQRQRNEDRLMFLTEEEPRSPWSSRAVRSRQRLCTDDIDKLSHRRHKIGQPTPYTTTTTVVADSSAGGGDAAYVSGWNNKFWAEDRLVQAIKDPELAHVMHPQRLYVRPAEVATFDRRNVSPQCSNYILQQLKRRHLVDLGTPPSAPSASPSSGSVGRRRTEPLPQWAKSAPAVEAFLRRGPLLSPPAAASAPVEQPERFEEEEEEEEEEWTGGDANDNHYYER